MGALTYHEAVTDPQEEPEREPGGVWRICLAVMFLMVGIGAAGGAVLLTGDEPRPPDLGGPILARAPVTPTAIPSPPAGGIPSAIPGPASVPNAGGPRQPYAAAKPAPAVTVRPVPLSVPPEPPQSTRPSAGQVVAPAA
jgi:hypothetical protein